MVLFNVLYIDSCQWGEWDDRTQECDSRVCGPQNYTRTRKSVQNKQHCETDDNLENWKTLEECPLNECIGNQISNLVNCIIYSKLFVVLKRIIYANPNLLISNLNMKFSTNDDF